MATRREKWRKIRDEYRIQLYCKLRERDDASITHSSTNLNTVSLHPKEMYKENNNNSVVPRIRSHHDT